MSRNFLRQPFLYFVLGAFVLFGIDALRKGPDDDRSISIGDADIARLASGWERTWGSAPTEEELEGLVQDWIAEEVYVRQAEALGLGEGDPLIRKYLRRKMELLTEGVVIVPEPTDADLLAYYQAHIADFSSEPLVSFRQASIDRGYEDELSNLVDALNDGAEVETLETIADADSMQGADRFHVSREYGVSFYDHLVGIPPGHWQGPVASSIGVHLVMVDEVRAAEPVPFELARPAVKSAWSADMREKLERESFGRLKSYYDISVEGAPE